MTVDARTLILTVADLTALVRAVGPTTLMREVIDAVRVQLRDGEDELAIRARAGFTYARPQPGTLEWMPVLREGDRAVVKVVSYNPHNPTTTGLPTIVSTMADYDPCTGHLRALCDATLATALRTGAASAIASGLLARPDARVLGLVGAGAQAVTQLQALALAFDLDEVLIHDVDPRALASFAARTAFVGVASRPAALAELVRRSDIICTATSSGVGQGPVIPAEGLAPEVHINAVGSDLPGKIELPRALLERAFVCPDFRSQALIEGECQQLSDAAAIGPELAELVRDPGRAAAARAGVTVFDSTGLALEDLAVMEVLLGHAERLGLGHRLALEILAGDPLDPYGFMRAPVELAASRRAEVGT